MSDISGREVHIWEEDVEVEDKVGLLRSPSEVGDMIESGNSFDAMLFRLMSKADIKSWKILVKAFPHQSTEYVSYIHYRSQGA